MPKIYLAGAMGYYHEIGEYEKATAWREDIKNELIALNEQYGTDFEWFDPSPNFGELVKVLNNRDILTQNTYYLNQCDLMIVNADHLETSSGTIYEITKFGLEGKPIIAFGWSDWLKKPHIEPFITTCLNEDAIIKYLEVLYIQ